MLATCNHMKSATKRSLGAAAIILAAALVLSFALSAQAQALTIERWTAKSNQDGENAVLGATPTRVTWQGQSDEGESLSQVTIELPGGSTVEASNVKTTVLNGLDRLDVGSEVSVEDGTRVVVSFPSRRRPVRLSWWSATERSCPPMEARTGLRAAMSQPRDRPSPCRHPTRSSTLSAPLLPSSCRVC